MASPTSPPGDKVAPTRHVKFSREQRPSFSLRGSLDARAKSDIRRSSKSLDLMKAEDDVNESSPLLRARASEDVGPLPPLSNLTSPRSDESWDVEGGLEQESKSSWYMFLLTLSIAGVQISWSVELSNGSPYLLGLGISKSLLALVWIAGPLSGALVQPYVGIQSDRCRSRFGKRRPFMVGGAVTTIICLMALAWTRELIGGFLSLFGIPRDSDATATVAIVFAVFMIYVLDFAINVIQAGVRAFIVDNAPPHQQDGANAWASRISGMASIFCYLFGYVNLPKYLGFFGNTQFKVLCVIASLALTVTLSISCLCIRERDPRSEGDPDKLQGGVLHFFIDLYRSMRRLPEQISRVCQVQFFAWIGWFPFLFYITTFVGEIYVEPFFAANPNMTPAEIDEVWERGTRQGTFALLIFAMTTFASSVILPFVIASSYKAPAPPMVTPMTPGAAEPTTPRTPHTPGGTSTTGYFGYHPPNTGGDSSMKGSQTLEPVRRFLHIPHSIEIRWLTLRRAWLLSHILFAILCWMTLFTRNVTSATILVACIGVPWSMTNWAPFSLIAAEISTRDAIRRGTLRPPHTRDGELLAAGEDPAEGADQAGVVLGIHNVSIAAPQVLATLVSSAIFRLLQKPRGSMGDDSVAWVLRFGGCAALVAAYLTRRVKEQGQP